MKMETICQQCGGKGFENAFVYCVKCLNFAVHRYCLPKLPKTFDEFVRWYCEDCESKSAKQYLLEKPCSIPSTKRNHKIAKGFRGRKSRNKSKKKDVSCPVPETEEHEHQSIPSQISPESHDKLALTDCAQLVGDCSLAEVELKKMGQGVVCTVVETDDQGQESSPSQQHSGAHTKLQLIEHAQLASDCSSPLIENTSIRDNVTHSVAETEEQKCPSSRSPQPCEAQTELALCVVSSSPLNENTSIPPCSENHGNDLKLGKRGRLIVEGGIKLGEEAESAGIDDSQTADLSNTLDHLHAQPLSDQIWRGSFSICNKVFGIFSGIVAHLSSTACKKVFEEAALLPALLRLEMLPKSDVWPESFQRSEPCDEHIALYFFPENKYYEWVFDCLVADMMDQELAMRAILNNAELLVFPSAELPIQYWKFKGKYYLWGVFRKKQDSSVYPADQRLVVRNSNAERLVYSDSENGVDTGDERSLVRTKTWHARSPLSPLSNSCSSG